MNRRSFLSGIIAAPAVITTPGLLMPVRTWTYPDQWGYKPIRGEIKQFYTIEDVRSLVMQVFTGQDWMMVNPASKAQTLTSFGWSLDQITNHITPPTHLLTEYLQLIEFSKNPKI